MWWWVVTEKKERSNPHKCYHLCPIWLPLHGMITANSASEHDDEASITSYSARRRRTPTASRRAASHPSLHGALTQHQSSASGQQMQSTHTPAAHSPAKPHSSSPPAVEAARGAGAGAEKASFLIGFAGARKAFFLIVFWVSLLLLLPLPNNGMSAYILLQHRPWSLFDSKAWVKKFFFPSNFWFLLSKFSPLCQ